MNPFDKYNNQADVVSIDKWLAQQQLMNKAKKAPPKAKGNFFTHLLPTIGGTGGGVAGGAAGGALAGTAILPGVGTAAGGLVGALLGGFAGGAAGKAVENKVEGNPLGGGVAGQGLEQGILSAGPLRLGRLGVDTVRGVKAGTGLADAIAGAGESAANMSIKKAVGNKLQNSGQSLIAKEFRLNPTQQANFKALHGEEAVNVLRRYGIQKPADLEAKITPLQGAFDSVVEKIPAASKTEVSNAMKAIYTPLLKSPVLTRQQLGKQIEAQSSEVLKAYKGDIPATELNKLKQSFDDAVTYTQKGTNEFTVNKKSADAIRKLMQGKADKAGLKFEGKTFKDVGLELRKLHNLNDVVGKQSYLGTGSLPLNIPNLLGYTAGGAAGGAPGAVAVGTATQLVNSPAGRRIAANGTIKIGEKLTGSGAASPYSAAGVAKRTVPVGLAEALLGSQSEGNNIATNATTTNATIMPNATNMDAQYTGSDGMSSPDQQGSPYSQENLMADIQRDPKNADKYISTYESLDKIFNSQVKETPAYGKPTAQQYSQGTTGENSINQLAQLIGQDPGVVNRNATPGQNLPGVGGVVSRAAGTNTYRATANNILNSIARINTGANMPASEESFYSRTYLPQPGDPPETVAAKLQQLRQFFAPITNYQSAGSSNSLEDALLAQGGIR